MNRKHGKSRSPAYLSWRAMRDRCLNQNSTSYRWYGAAGIKVCERWERFESFLADMGERPAGMSLERIDRTKGYEPSNCRWATSKDQARNRRTNNVIAYLGESLTLEQWAERYEIPSNTLWMRLNNGWDVHRALTQPLAPNGGRFAPRSQN